MKGVRYPAEFKAEAVKQVTDRGHGVAEVAKRLGTLRIKPQHAEETGRSGKLGALF